MSLWPHIVHILAKQQSKSFSVVLLYTYKYFVTTFKRTIKPITKNIYNKQKCPANHIIAHGVSEAMHAEVPQTLEDPEQRPQGHACGCSSQHAQRQVAVVVSVPLTNDDLVGRLLSIKPWKRRKEQRSSLWSSTFTQKDSSLAWDPSWGFSMHSTPPTDSSPSESWAWGVTLVSAPQLSFTTGEGDSAWPSEGDTPYLRWN